MEGGVRGGIHRAHGYFGGDGHAYYLDCGDDYPDVWWHIKMQKSIRLHTLNTHTRIQLWS